MGSRRIFAFGRCPRCERFVVEPCDPPVELCLECDVDCRSPFVYRLLRQRLRREPHPDMVATIAGYVATYRIRRIRKLFLVMVLLQQSGAPMSLATHIRQLLFPPSNITMLTDEEAYYHFGHHYDVEGTERILNILMSFL